MSAVPHHSATFPPSKRAMRYASKATNWPVGATPTNAPAWVDHIAAFARYQARMMAFLKRKQESAAKSASSFAPASAIGITVRNLVTQLLRIPFFADFFVGRDLRDDIELPNYGF
jgi:hypothetical protein